MDKGYPNVEHAPLHTGGAVLDGFHPWDRPPPVPKYFPLVPQAKYGPLIGPGVPLWRRAFRALSISQETQEFPHPATNDPGWVRPPVCGAPGGHSQAT